MQCNFVLTHKLRGSKIRFAQASLFLYGILIRGEQKSFNPFSNVRFLGFSNKNFIFYAFFSIIIFAIFQKKIFSEKHLSIIDLLLFFYNRLQVFLLLAEPPLG